ncbi:LOW QUALITY PROTEIN: uncharacterized protein LOC124266663 [Haliotis rubra]|uniref:LOW QUALITY PROTEIN: uncharacterized protein LOC124266663 n=1 Tax=Haliotis rubra TaxID=36100 RepID=UPI001EE51F0E|nr:LOW QUALITY PROTEIN: uncharacterized protein LOC124266663 [Haliotis rubra]
MALKLRPVLDHRMPTLATKAAFTMVGDVSAQHKKRSALRQLETCPPRCLKEVRQLITMEIKHIHRCLSRLERSYYGGRRTVHQEIEKIIYPTKTIMKAALIFECNSSTNVDDVLMQFGLPGFKGSAENSQLFHDVYAKLKSYLPDKISDVTHSCQKLCELMNKYCVSFYDPNSEKEGYLETSAHYQEQIQSWSTNIELSLTNAKEVYRRFKGKGITTSHLTPPVENFVSKHNLHKVLFLVIFADACTNIRNALSLMTSWLKTDETYSGFLKIDIIDLDTLKEEKIKALRESRSKYHSLTFRLSQSELECSKAETEVMNLRERRDNHLREEEHLEKQVNDTELEIEFKEYRRESFKVVLDDSHPDVSAETYDVLTEDLKNLKERLPGLQRQLATVRYKLKWVEEKTHQQEKIEEEIQLIQKELREAGEERGRKEKEYLEVEKSLKLARRILLCKTSNDAVEKIYYSIPVHARNSRPTGVRAKTATPLDKACKVISRTIERDWVNVYRNLPFFPKRGAETIERDISELSTTGARVTLIIVARRALGRWRRYHTRAMVDDLKTALQKIRRLDVIKAIEDELNPPVKDDDEEDMDEKVPPVPPELLPFYELGERYDQLRAMNRM